MKARHKRLALVAGGLGALAIAATLVLSAFRENLVFFFSPTDVAAGKAPQGRSFRIGGLVEKGTVQRLADGVTVSFVVTDTSATIPVQFKGVLPDLFKECKGVVTQGKLGADGTFVASEVLAKHDENYMPPEAQDAVSKAHQASDRTKTKCTAEDMGQMMASKAGKEGAPK
jgi:cytochrome c-type biogenesis protein CcmE